MKRTGTRHPGIYRRGDAYTYIYRDALGRQRERAARTLDEARREKARMEKLARDGATDPSSVTLHAFLDEWIDRYQGTGRRGFREETRSEYRALLERYAKRHFGVRAKLGQVSPNDISKFIGWLVKQPNGRGGTLSDKSIKNALNPLSAALRTARREGLIPHDPSTDAQLPHRPRVEDDDEDVRHLEQAQLVTLIALVHPDQRLLVRFTAETGLRASEVIGLDVRHLMLDGERPVVRVRQRSRAGRVGALKSAYARRDVPLSRGLVDELRVHVRGVERSLPLFRNEVGGRVDRDNIRNRVIKPAAEEAGVGWAGWHTLRHTCASLLFERGRNVVQVQRWLGHHSPSFTLDTYVHLLEGGVGEPLDLHGTGQAAHGAIDPTAVR
jgi:integrase